MTCRANRDPNFVFSYFLILVAAWVSTACRCGVDKFEWGVAKSGCGFAKTGPGGGKGVAYLSG
jgi:hypothetical protein